METQEELVPRLPNGPAELIIVLNGVALQHWIGWKPYTNAEKGLVRQRLFEFGEKITEALRSQMPDTPIWFIITGYDFGYDMLIKEDGDGKVCYDPELTIRLESAKLDLIESGIFSV